MLKLNVVLLLLTPMILVGCSDVYMPKIIPSNQPQIVFTRINFSENQPHVMGEVKPQVMAIDEYGDSPVALDNGSIVSSPRNGSMIWSHADADGINRSVIISNSSGVKIREIVPQGAALSFLGGYSAALSYDATRISYIMDETHLRESESDGSDIQDPCYGVVVGSLGMMGIENTRDAYYHDTGHNIDSTVISQYLLLHYKQFAPGMDTCSSVGRAYPYEDDKTSGVDWSHTSGRMLYSYKSSLYRSDSKAKPFASGFSATHSPDNTQIAYTSVEGEIMIFTIKDGTTINVTNTPLEYEAYPQWSPDGTRLLFTSFSKQLDMGAGTLTVINLQTGTRKPIYTPAYKGFWVR